MRTPAEITLRDASDEVVRGYFHAQSPDALVRMARWISRDPERGHWIELYESRRFQLHFIPAPQTHSMAAYLRLLAERLR
jgi:hypothetical protein